MGWKTSLALLPLLTACATRGPDIPLEQVPRTLAEASCGHYFQCCTLDEIRGQIWPLDQTTDLADCSERLELMLSAAVDLRQPALAAGQVTYSGAAVGRCLDHIEGRACGSLELQLCDVSAFFEPRQGIGEPCLGDEACTSGHCERLEPGGDTCQPDEELGGPGETCARDAECAPPLRCRCPEPIPGCSQKTCRGDLPQDTSCSLDAECQDELYCEARSICTPRQAEGEDCLGGECAIGLVCDTLRGECAGICY